MDTGFLDAIRGQEAAVSALKTALQQQRISHAWRFCGPPGCGKETVARELARHLLLADDAAGKVFFDQGGHPDLMLVEVPENKTLIGVEQIAREMNPWLFNRPARAQRRVVIIREADRLSIPAANALLKTLEEPPDYAVIILISEQDGMLDTIISRCQNLRFIALNDDSVCQLLIQRDIAPDTAREVAQAAAGNMQSALALAASNKLAEYKEHSVALCGALASGQYIEVFKAAEALEKDPLLLNFIEMTLRDFYLYRHKGGAAALMLPELTPHYDQWPYNRRTGALDALRELNRLRSYYQSSANKTLLAVNVAWTIHHVFY
ncbi:MAG: AAA family ATPase [Syntrophomonadaceae bacterium]|nr:AAA family ATPase [Syntrophomonadaceae bacterium]